MGSPPPNRDALESRPVPTSGVAIPHGSLVVGRARVHFAAEGGTIGLPAGALTKSARADGVRRVREDFLVADVSREGVLRQRLDTDGARERVVLAGGRGRRNSPSI